MARDPAHRALISTAGAGRTEDMIHLSSRARAALYGLALFLGLPVELCADPLLGAIRGIERDLNARVGFYMHDLHTAEVVAYAQDDRFALNSTFKVLACGALLHRVERGAVRLTDTVRLQDVQVVDYSPAIIAHRRAGQSEVTLGEACGMMLSVSDNTAANIVLRAIGGPEGLTTYLRSIGDPVTRLDRWETALNSAVPGDLRDTTTPRAIAHSVRRLILEDTLAPASRAILRAWLADHRVADALFRAALPSTWSIEDRTGAGGHGSRSIVAVLYPPDRQPIVASLFITETQADFDARNAAVARIGAALVAHVTRE